jgi:hypothetical protein
MSSTILLPPRAHLCIRYCSNKQQQARLEACARQKTAKNATEFTLYSTSTSISGIFSVACHRWEATTDADAAAPPPPLPPPPPRSPMDSQVQEPQDVTCRLLLLLLLAPPPPLPPPLPPPPPS